MTSSGCRDLKQPCPAGSPETKQDDVELADLLQGAGSCRGGIRSVSGCAKRSATIALVTNPARTRPISMYFLARHRVRSQPTFARKITG